MVSANRKLVFCMLATTTIIFSFLGAYPQIRLPALLKSHSNSNERYAFVCGAVNDGYGQGCIVVAKSLILSGSCSSKDVDIVILALNETSEEVLRSIKGINPDMVKVHNVETIRGGTETTHYRDSFVKLRVWELLEYRKVIWLDSDLIVKADIYHLFEEEELTAPDELFMLYFDPSIFTTGMFLAEPSVITFNALMESTRTKKFAADMPLLNDYFRPKKRLGLSYLVLAWVFEMPGMLYKELYDVAKTIHFNGKKPWQEAPDDVRINAVLLYDLWMRVFEFSEDKIVGMHYVTGMNASILRNPFKD